MKVICHLVLATVVAAATALAQNAELDRLERLYREQLVKTLGPAVSEYEKKLLALEKSRATAANYLGAQRAKERADQVAADLRALVESRGETAIVLAPAEAKLTGAVTFDRAADALRRWQTVGSRASWDLRRIEPGSYEVEIAYAVPPEVENENRRTFEEPAMITSGGSIAVQEATSLRVDSAEPLTASLKSTGGAESYQRKKLGKLTFTGTSTTVSVEATAVEPGGLMTLKALTLYPMAPGADGDAPSPVAKQFAALKDAQMENLRNLLEPTSLAYVDELKTLEATLVEADDIEGLAAIRDELDRLSRRGDSNLPDDLDPPADDEAIILPAADPFGVRTTGETSPNPSKEFLLDLRPVGATVSWDLGRHQINPGFYDVTLLARTPDHGGGTFEIQAGDSGFTGTLASKRSEKDSFQVIPVGALYVAPDVPTLTLLVTALSENARTLCELSSVTLRPTAGPDGTIGGVAGEDAGWTVISGAQFVRQRDNAADAFSIRKGGDEFRLRLYGIDAPEPRYDPTETAANELQLAVFRAASTRELAAVGEDGIDAVEALLAPGTFTVFTKHEPAGDGRIYAFVVAGEGLVSHQLVRTGLAIAAGKTADVPEVVRPGVTGSTLSIFLAGEQAKAQAEQLGLWKP